MTDGLNLWQWKQSLLNKGPDNPMYKHLLLTLSCFMNQKGKSCFPSINKIEDCSSLSRPTVIKYLKKAKKDGWIKVKKRGIEGKAWNRNEYEAAIPKAVKEINCDDDVAVKEVNHQGDKAVNLFNEGSKRGLPKAVKQVNSNNPTNNTTNKEESKAVKEVNRQDSSHPLQEYVKEELEEVSKLEKQLTASNCESLIEDFGKTQVHEVLLAMENYKGLTKKYTSVNLTVRNWCKRRNEDKDESSNNRPTQQIV